MPKKTFRSPVTIPPWLLAIFAALLAGGALVVTVGTREDPTSPSTPAATSPPVVTKVDADADGRRDDPLIVPMANAEQLDQGLKSRDSELTTPLRESDDPSLTPPGVIEGPLAADEIPGCRTRFVGNYSSRNGAQVGVGVLHQTVSPERGLASQNALTSLANRRSSGVSWHVLVGPTNGRCTYTVPLRMKAWTQGNANPVAVGIEVERVGNEPTYVEGAGKHKLISVMRHISHQFNLPLQHGKVVFDSSCRPTVVRRGWVEHSDLGRCGGGHADVTPWPTGGLIRDASLGAAASTKTYRDSDYRLGVLTAQERRQARTLLAERRVALRRGGWERVAPSHLRAAEKAKAALVQRRDWLAKRLSDRAARADRYRVLRFVIAV